MKRWALVAIVLCATGLAAHKAEAVDRVAQLEKRVEQLEQRVAALETLLNKLLSGKMEPVGPTQIRPGGYQNRDNWRLLQLGMTKEQVSKILGKAPKQRTGSALGDRWYYPDAQGGSVHFDWNNNVDGWNEPPPASFPDK